MSRHLLIPLWLIAATACGGLIDKDLGGLTPEQVKAQKLWVDRALPQLQANCASCHDGSMANIGWLAGTGDLDKRTSVMTYTSATAPSIVDLGTPQLSLLLIKGSHDGPAFNGEQASDERDANPDAGGGGIETEPFAIQICTSGLPDDPAAPNPLCPVNKVSLDSVGATGAFIHLVVERLNPGIYMTNLKLVPGAGGAYIEHPLFITFPADGSEPKLDSIDRFAGLTMNLMGTATPQEQVIGTGTASFTDFLDTDMISIHFQAAEPFKAQ